MAKNKKTKVMFVGGYGRSGSTIIDILLDRVPGITAVGEFRHLFGRALGDNELCSCGETFNSCSFWIEVIKKAFPGGFNRNEIQHAVQAYNKMIHIPQLQHDNLRSETMQHYAKIYSDAFSAAYQAVAEVSGSSVIIDSTKYPLHGLFISKLPSIDLSTTLLIRDPRAVAHSWQRHRLRPEVHWEEREMPRHSISRSALAWNMSNSLTRLLETPDYRFRTQRYEDFIEDPLKTISEIASFALGKKTIVDQQIFEKQPSTPHTIAGNPVRIGSENIKVRPDSAWRQQMSPAKQAIVTALCAKQMRQYGYSLSIK